MPKPMPLPPSPDLQLMSLRQTEADLAAATRRIRRSFPDLHEPATQLLAAVRGKKYRIEDLLRRRRHQKAAGASGDLQPTT